MNKQTLQQKFNEGISWNSLLFIFNKAAYFIISLILYKKMPSRDFSLWANMMSMIFLILLWLDCGFRKSIPRFLPLFTSSVKTLKQFLLFIISFQGILLCCGAPLFYSITNYFFHPSQTLLVTFSLLFILEGFISIARLIFHSYFWQKQFNTMVSYVLGTYTVAILWLAWYIQHSHQLLYTIILLKIVANCMILAYSTILLKQLYADLQTKQASSVEDHKTMISFAKHSFVMATTTITKSLTERNALVPLFTLLFGPEIANMFKITNDGALFFQRIVIKSIGTTDTSVLTYATLDPNKKQLVPQLFADLLKKTFLLAIPLLVIILIFSQKLFGTLYNPYGLKLFFLLAVSYLIHLMLFPFERILEVKKNYTSLWLGHLPYYLLFLFIGIWFNKLRSYSLISLVLIVHIIRLTSAFILFSRAKKTITLSIPIKTALFTLLISLILCLLAFLPLSFIL